MRNTPNVVKASFKVRGSTDANDSFDVHFNPESLQYTITNNIRNTGAGTSTKQYLDENTGNLTMELIFDTTDNGENVRLHTARVAQLMEPDESDNTPPIVDFEWGLYTFAGMMASYQETIDFFSSDGVPLRASVNLTLSSHDELFEGGEDERNTNTGTVGALGSRTGNSVQIPSNSDGRGVTQTATQAGNPVAARLIAAQNGLENMRFPGAVQLQINDISESAGVTPMAALNAGASTNQHSVFDSLHTQARRSVSGSLKLNEFLRSAGTAQLGMEDTAGFSLGGQARLQGSASFKADVGKAGALKARIEFDGGE